MGKNYKHLSAEDRGAIDAMILQGNSIRSIARLLGRAPSTIKRELDRNGWKPPIVDKPVMGRPRQRPAYEASRAGNLARRNRHKARRARKLRPGEPDNALWTKVRVKLDKRWSPEQIAQHLRQAHPTEPNLQASHETIYTAIYAMPKGEFKKEVISLLRQRRKNREAHGRSERRGDYQDVLSIHMRPPEVEDRLVPGHWEGDLIKGKNNKSAVGTLVCRKTRFAMLVKLDGATAKDVFEGFEMAFSPLDEAMRKTLTYDRGKEMAWHEKLAQSTGLKIYFCDPHSPWQRGSNENTNGLLRDFLPKGTDLSIHSQDDLDRIARSLNNRPRQTLGWKTPAEAFFEECLKYKASVQPGVALAP